MKKMILAVVAVLGLTATGVPAANAASSVVGDRSATRTQQTGGFSGGGN